MEPLHGSWFWLFLAIGLAVGALFGVLLGLPVLRLRGDYLAIVTLGLGEVIRVLATNLDRPINITNGSQGIKDVGRPPLFIEPIFQSLGITISRVQEYQLYFYFLVLIILGGMGSIPGTMLGAVIVTLLDLQLLPRIASELAALQRRGVPIPAWFDPAQYQRLLFGLLLIIMMIFRPEGLLPEDRRRQELHHDEPEPAPETQQAASVTETAQSAEG
jgi:ABC-type branched-subunit amino acid transport system permease subunit